MRLHRPLTDHLLPAARAERLMRSRSGERSRDRTTATRSNRFPVPRGANYFWERSGTEFDLAARTHRGTFAQVAEGIFAEAGQSANVFARAGRTSFRLALKHSRNEPDV